MVMGGGTDPILGANIMKYLTWWSEMTLDY